MAAPDTRKPGVRLESNQRLKALMAGYFAGLGEAQRSGRPVAWCTSVGPAELLRALGFEVFFPENHGAMLGTTRMALQTMPRAHAAGYSQDICSYLTSDVGAFLADLTPLTRAYGLERVPRPAVLVYNTNQCREVKDWFAWYGRELDVPVVGIRSPQELDTPGPDAAAYVARQMRDVADRLAHLAPEALEIARLREHITLSREACLLWKRCLETAAARPAPWAFSDHTVHMAPIVVLRGTIEAVDYYRHLAAELEALAEAGQGVVPGERHRVYWEGMPIWSQLRPLAELFADLRCAVVASTYCNSWIFDFADGDPWESMARAYLSIFICRSESFKEGYIARMCRQFGAAGVVFHDAKTCPHNTNSRFGMPGRLKEGAGLQTLVLEGDLNDPRCFAFEEARVRLEAFVEQLEDAAATGVDPARPGAGEPGR